MVFGCQKTFGVLGSQSHSLDTCLFRYFDSTGALICLVGIHVDDVLCTGLESSAEYQKLKQLLQKEFNFKHWTEEENGKPLEFCGPKLENSEGTLRLHQQDYIKNVKPVTCKDQNADRELSGAEVSSLGALLGALQWSERILSHRVAHRNVLSGKMDQNYIILDWRAFSNFLAFRGAA